jgi:membrane protease YdiL (CAAX protease family)
MILCLFVLPALAMRAMDMRLRDHGMRLGHRVDGPVYGLLFAFMVPVVLVSAMTPGFREFYPLWRPVEGEPLWPRFFVWEAAYMAQFVAVEFFFRGVLIHAARPRFGAYAILLPMIPYMMVHFGKPAGEAAASVVAGLVLGYLSLRTGSIAYGVLLHGGVALTMDLTALWLQGRLF